MTDGKKPEMPNQYQEWLDKVPEDEHRTHWADCWTVHIQCAIARAARLQSDLIAAQKERDDWKARAIGIDITLEGSNERFRKAEQALALRGEPVALKGWVIKPGVADGTRPSMLVIAQDKSAFVASEQDDSIASIVLAKLASALYTAPISGEVVAKPDYDRLFAETRIYDNAVSGERVREALDAARWQRFCEMWAASTELSATQDESGFWIIRQIEAVENETFGALVGETPDDAIDKALPLAAIQGETNE